MPSPPVLPLYPALSAHSEEIEAWAESGFACVFGGGLGFRFDYFDDIRIVNTLAAHRLLAWTDAEGAKHSLRIALFSAYFFERKDVGDSETLADAATSVGLDRAEASAVRCS